MNLVPLIIIFIIAFMLQYLFTFMQIRSFNGAYRLLKNQGRVAIGSYKGSFFAGAIVMFSVGEDGVIIEGKIMQGVTVFARFKSLGGFEGLPIEKIDARYCKSIRLPRPIIKAVSEAANNYQIFQEGGEILEKESGISKLFHMFTKKQID
ncbi:MAG: transcriptional regulator GutM [Erysipelotrichaceae bacterium]|nr:transcriptional regulator GutM [Erysipelotrichaceae bacterium]